MRIKLLGLMALCLMSLITGSAKGQTILYWADVTVGTPYMSQALAALPGGYTVTTATSDADFTTKITSGSYDLGILLIQNFPSSGYTSPGALGTFVSGGGKAIYTDWSGDNALAVPFGASFTGNQNDTTINIAASNLATGVNNPATLTNPGFGIFSTGLNAIGGSTVQASFGNGDAAIVLNASGTSYFNGFLDGTLTTGSDGVNLYTNEITGLFAAVPEPTTWAMIGVVTFGTGAFAWNKRRKATKNRFAKAK
ncbi:MAG TPA: PEP-CTERM sorting domain-containing protein [Gemmatales bacterium]|nr:PEP-CTERM sorting domain-containing protein [Gemmatales bacterium]